MHRWIKYGAVISGFAAPFVLHVAYAQGGLDFVYKLVPGVLIWYLIEAIDLKQKVSGHLPFAPKLGRHDLSELVGRFDKSIEKLGQARNYIYLEAVYRCIEKFTASLERSSNEWSIKITGQELSTIPIKLSERLSRSLDATRVWQHDDLSEGFGSIYDTNIRAAIEQRRALVRRLYILQNEEEYEQAKRRMQQHHDDGIKVKYIYVETWRRNLTSKPIDFGVWDKQLVWEYNMEGNNSGGIEAVVYCRDENVKDASNRFEAGWIRGIEFGSVK